MMGIGLMKQRVLFISSSGGHLAEIFKVRTLFDKYDYLLVTERDNFTKSFKNKYNIKYLLRGTRCKPISYFFVCLFNIIKSLIIFLKFKPDIIYTTGAHTCVPMCFIAHLRHKKVIFIEVYDRIDNPSLTAKIVYKIADTFIVQHEEMLKLFPKAVYIGGVY